MISMRKDENGYLCVKCKEGLELGYAPESTIPSVLFLREIFEELQVGGVAVIKRRQPVEALSLGMEISEPFASSVTNYKSTINQRGLSKKKIRKLIREELRAMGFAVPPGRR